MRMFDRLPREEADEVLAFVQSDDDAAVEQAIDTVARRLVANRVAADDSFGWSDFPEVGEHDWQRVEQRAAQLIKDVDRGQGPYEAAYKLLGARADHEPV